jgi:uncharacterized protein YdaU (DUF1376 family)
MNDNHWYPRDPQRYLTDTQWCDAATEVAHIRLLDTYYALGKPIKDFREELQNIGKIKDADYARVRGNLERLGWRFENGELRHKRVEETMAEMEENRLAQIRRTAAATEARRNATKNVTDDVTSNVTGSVTSSQPQPQPQPYLKPQQQPFDKASAPVAPRVHPSKPTKSTKLSERQKEIADSLEQSLGDEWINDAGKWIGRIKCETSKAERVAAEVANAVKEQRIATTPAAYAEDTWKRFK